MSPTPPSAPLPRAAPPPSPRTHLTALLHACTCNLHDSCSRPAGANEASSGFLHPLRLAVPPPPRKTNPKAEKWIQNHTAGRIGMYTRGPAYSSYIHTSCTSGDASSALAAVGGGGLDQRGQGGRLQLLLRWVDDGAGVGADGAPAAHVHTHACMRQGRGRRRHTHIRASAPGTPAVCTCALCAARAWGRQAARLVQLPLPTANYQLQTPNSQLPTANCPRDLVPAPTISLPSPAHTRPHAHT